MKINNPCALAPLKNGSAFSDRSTSLEIREFGNDVLDNIPICSPSPLFTDSLSNHSSVSHSSSCSPVQVNPPDLSFTSSEILPQSPAFPVPLSAEGLKRKQPPLQFASFDQLNFSDRDELDVCQHLMSESQRHLWKIRNTKASSKFKKRYSDKYLDSVTFQIASESRLAPKVTHCMHSHPGGLATPCKSWCLCDRCAFHEGTLHLQRYSKIFDRDFRFFSVTLGFNGHLPFSSNTAENCRPFWEANKRLIRSLLDTDAISGAYLVHELKISGFLPLTANPHSHALIVSDHPLDEMEEQIQNMVAQHAGLSLQPSIRIREIGNTAQDHENVIRYLTKSIDLVPAYQTAWNTHCSLNRDQAPELNREVKECFDSISAAFDHYKKTYCVGNLHSHSTHFIGQSKKAVLKQQKKVKLKRKLKAHNEATKRTRHS